MNPENIDLNAVIALLESKRIALESAISALRAVVASGAMGTTSDGVTMDFSVPFSASGSGGVPDGAFHGKTIPEAIRLYLELMRKKQTAREISDGLKKGGLESTSKYFDKMIYATLDRLKKSREVVKIGSEWGIPQWYPALMRASITENGHKPRTRGRPRKGAAKPRTFKATSFIYEDQKPSDLILGFLLESPGIHTAEEIRDAAKIKDVKVAMLLLGQLAKKGKVKKTEDGKYQVVKAA